MRINILRYTLTNTNNRVLEDTFSTLRACGIDDQLNVGSIAFYHATVDNATVHDGPHDQGGAQSEWPYKVLGVMSAR